ncbi:MAG: PP2C family serine/threonine-protein phosphatase [Pyrinomonadaceae bacterium]
MSAENWRVAQASVTGESHLNQNAECQDRFLCRSIETDEGEILIAVVADGAGSTTRGGRGAEIACEFFAEQISEFLKSDAASVGSLNEDFGKLWISFFQAKIAEIADAEKIETREFASTLVGAVVGKTDAVFYQVGDGAAVFSANGKAGSYRFSIAPAESEYVNMTEFLTDETATENLRFVCVKETIEDLILFSDGIFAVAVDYQTNQPHEPFLMPMIAPLRNGNDGKSLNEKLEKFLASPKLSEKTDDDKTIILASRYGNFKN